MKNPEIIGTEGASLQDRRQSDRRNIGDLRKQKRRSTFKVALPERYVEIVRKKEAKEIEEDVQEVEQYQGPSIAEIEQQIIEHKKAERTELDQMRRQAEEEANRIMREAEEAAFSKIKEAEEEFKRAMDRLKIESEEMISSAEQRSTEIELEIEQRREEIYEQQKTRGYREGWDAGYQEGEQELKKINERLESIIRAVTEKRVEIIESSERQLVEIIRLVSRKVVKKIIEDHDDIIIYNIKEALSRIRDKSHLTIRVNFSDLKLTLEKKQEIIGMIENLQKVEIVEDSLIEPGGCLILTDFGEVDARISNQLSRIEDRILDMEYKP